MGALASCGKQRSWAHALLKYGGTEHSRDSTRHGWETCMWNREHGDQTRRRKARGPSRFQCREGWAGAGLGKPGLDGWHWQLAGGRNGRCLLWREREKERRDARYLRSTLHARRVPSLVGMVPSAPTGSCTTPPHGCLQRARFVPCSHQYELKFVLIATSIRKGYRSWHGRGLDTSRGR